MIHSIKIKRTIKAAGLILFFGSLLILSTVSCNHGPSYPKETATLDSLKKVLSSTDSMLINVDSLNIRKCINHVIITLDEVKMLTKDTVTRGAGQIFKSFADTKWELQTFLSRRTVLKQEIPKSIAQVEHLSHDLKNNLVNKDSAMIFYGFEVKKASELIETAKLGLAAVKMQLPLNEIIAPQADSLINRLKNHQRT